MVPRWQVVFLFFLCVSICLSCHASRDKEGAMHVTTSVSPLHQREAEEERKEPELEQRRESALFEKKIEHYFVLSIDGGGVEAPFPPVF